MAPFQTQIKVRFSDVDYARVVYFPQILHFFHCAFEDLLTHHGIEFRLMMDEEGVGFPIVHVEADFQHPLTLGDELLVNLCVEKIGKKTAVFSYQGLCAHSNDTAHTPIAKAKITVACVDMKTFKSKEVPPKYVGLFRSYLVANDR